MQHLVEKTESNHKIWSWRRGVGWLIAVLGLIAILVLYGELNKRQNPGLEQPEGWYFVDADCYSRMTRVRLLEEGRGPFLRWHDFENYPVGLRPHTTAPLDWIILAWHRLCGRSAAALDRSGFEISALLGALWLLLVWGWVVKLRLPYGWWVLGLLAVSPALLHAFAFGRPDHQSLVLLFCGAGLLVEILGYVEPGRQRWEWASGLCWGLAFWVSWFEPLVLLGLVWGVRGGLALSERGAQPGGVHAFGSWRSYVLTGLIALGVLVLEGLPGTGLPSELQGAFFRWSAAIGELQSANPWGLLARWGGWATWMVWPGLVVALAWRSRSGGGTRSILWLWLVLWVVLAALTAWHIRWGYFLVLVSLLALPWALAWLRWRWLGYLVLLAGFWPLAAELERTLFPEGAARVQREDQILEMRQLRQAAGFLREQPPGGLLATWWQTPALVYWSGHPGVGGSSHQSLPGNLLAAEVFLAASPEELLRAQAVLRERRVRYLLMGDSGRTLAQARLLLPERVRLGEESPLGQILDRSPSRAPAWLEPLLLSPAMKIYRVSE